MIPALSAYNDIVACLKNPGDDFSDIENFISEIVNTILEAYEDHITEWASSYRKNMGRDTTSGDTFFFGERRIVIGYNYLHDEAKYIQILVALMKDLPRPDLSIRKVIFVYDADLQKIIQIQDEMPEW